jgi:serine phosphatase RsbU (regulator of sigma subunit)
VKDGMDISLISIEGHHLQFAGANNPLWILRDGELIEIKGDKQPIGKHIQMTPFTNHQFDLKTDDVLYIFSDGYSDQFGGEKGKKMKSSNMKKLMLANSEKDLAKQKEVFEAEFTDWMGDFSQLDDVCLIGVKIK